LTTFEVTMPGKVVFGPGSIAKLGPEIRTKAARVLLVYSGNNDRVKSALESFKEQSIEISPFVVRGEPTLTAVRAGVKAAHDTDCLAVAAVGGGSVMDAGKAIAAMMTNPGDLLDYLEVIGAGKHLAMAPAFFIAVPTTAGTGTEATRNAVLTSEEHRVKVSLRHASMVPKVALLDPNLTLDLPPDVTASTGMDALCQLIEAFTCRSPNPFTDALCREGIRRAAQSLLKAYWEGSNVQARSDMMLASHFSGVALANAKLGAVHGFAAPLGGMYKAPHGALCAALLPAVLAANLRSLSEQGPGHPVLARYQEVAEIVTGEKDASPEDVTDYCERLRRELNIPRLSDMGVKREDFEELCQKASKASSMKGNPVDLSQEELSGILSSAF